MSFRKDFVWGAAAASYQIEGAAEEDGKGLSIWDTFCRQPGRIWAGQSGDVACDHYHRFAEDIALMQQIGLMAYRLSISWPRVLPAGVGPVNAKGLMFYDKLIDELLAADIEPYVTLFHWDYPHELYCRGGWLNPDSPKWFADYTKVVVDRLSDRVKHWMTLNEPQCFIHLGHQTGEHAPGVRLGFGDVLLAAHHVLLAHGKSVQAIRAAAKSDPKVGFAPVGRCRYPAADSRQDTEAARQATFTVDRKDVMNNTWWTDPIFLGRYPEDGLELFAEDLPPIAESDMETICQPLDFCGINHYQGVPVRSGADGRPEQVPHADGAAITAKRWFVTPQSLYWLAKFFHERYGKPVIITENGMSNSDWVSLDGKVHDPQRIDLTARYLRELARAADDGVDVRGYFHWSIMDNFEWAEGFKDRFGMIFIDYPTGRRILKDSAHWYADVIKSNGGNLG